APAVTVEHHDATSEHEQPRSARGIHETALDTYEVTSEVPSRGRLARAFSHFKRWVLGPPLPSQNERRERLTWAVALAILGADAIASSVYGPEEMLRILAEAGVPAVQSFALPISAAIVVLLA